MDTWGSIVPIWSIKKMYQTMSILLSFCSRFEISRHVHKCGIWRPEYDGDHMTCIMVFHCCQNSFVSKITCSEHFWTFCLKRSFVEVDGVGCEVLGRYVETNTISHRRHLNNKHGFTHLASRNDWMPRLGGKSCLWYCYGMLIKESVRSCKLLTKSTSFFKFRTGKLVFCILILTPFLFLITRKWRQLNW